MPARSMHRPLTDWFALSVVTTVGAGGLPAARPETESAHWKATVTLVLFQPLAFGPGVREATIAGGVLSSLMAVVLAASTLPALSAPKNVTAVMPSVLSANDVEVPEMAVLPIVWAPFALYVICLTPVPAVSLSEEFNVTITSELFHPLMLGVGERNAVLTGGVESIAIFRPDDTTCERTPLTPAMTGEYCPALVLGRVVIVRVAGPDPPLITGGENCAVAPCGRPVTLSVMSPVKPRSAEATT